MLPAKALPALETPETQSTPFGGTFWPATKQAPTPSPLPVGYVPACPGPQGPPRPPPLVGQMQPVPDHSLPARCAQPAPTVGVATAGLALWPEASVPSSPDAAVLRWEPAAARGIFPTAAVGNAVAQGTQAQVERWVGGKMEKTKPKITKRVKTPPQIYPPPDPDGADNEKCFISKNIGGPSFRIVEDFNSGSSTLRKRPMRKPGPNVKIREGTIVVNGW